MSLWPYFMTIGQCENKFLWGQRKKSHTLHSHITHAAIITRRTTTKMKVLNSVGRADKNRCLAEKNLKTTLNKKHPLIIMLYFIIFVKTWALFHCHHFLKILTCSCTLPANHFPCYFFLPANHENQFYGFTRLKMNTKCFCPNVTNQHTNFCNNRKLLAENLPD